MRSWLWSLLMLVAACTELEPSEGGGTAGGDPTATLLGRISTESYCGDPIVIEVQLRAFRIGCDPLSNAPCTLPAEPAETLGDRLSCPATSPTVLLGVDVAQPGVYLVDVAARHTTGDQAPDCFVEPGGTEEVPITAGDIEANAQVMLEAREGPCQQG